MVATSLMLFLIDCGIWRARCGGEMMICDGEAEAAKFLGYLPTPSG